MGHGVKVLDAGGRWHLYDTADTWRVVDEYLYVDDDTDGELLAMHAPGMWQAVALVGVSSVAE